MSMSPEGGTPDNGRFRKIVWAAGGIAAAGTAGVIAWEIFHHRQPNNPEEALYIFKAEQAEYHLPAIQIMDALLPDKCASFEDLLNATGYRGWNNRELDRVINGLSKRDMGDFALVKTVSPDDCQAERSWKAAHYEAADFAKEAYEKGLFDEALTDYRDGPSA